MVKIPSLVMSNLKTKCKKWATQSITIMLTMEYLLQRSGLHMYTARARLSHMQESVHIIKMVLQNEKSETSKTWQEPCCCTQRNNGQVLFLKYCGHMPSATQLKY